MGNFGPSGLQRLRSSVEASPYILPTITRLIWNAKGYEAHFSTPGQWRAWLEEPHDQAKELWLGFHNKAAKSGGSQFAKQLLKLGLMQPAGLDRGAVSKRQET